MPRHPRRNQERHQQGMGIGRRQIQTENRKATWPFTSSPSEGRGSKVE